MSQQKGEARHTDEVQVPESGQRNAEEVEGVEEQKQLVGSSKIQEETNRREARGGLSAFLQGEVDQDLVIDHADMLIELGDQAVDVVDISTAIAGQVDPGDRPFRQVIQLRGHLVDGEILAMGERNVRWTPFPRTEEHHTIANHLEELPGAEELDHWHVERNIHREDPAHLCVVVARQEVRRGFLPVTEPLTEEKTIGSIRLEKKENGRRKMGDTSQWTVPVVFMRKQSCAVFSA